ncbi:hypothetical protein HanRHA438_Chr04g0200621 [Helianthus annuus]|nr:hypothetical protein HanRHA438_Chr04g0200621 [Helianthus annuus]
MMRLGLLRIYDDEIKTGESFVLRTNFDYRLQNEAIMGVYYH